jgi:hypothetical protein
MTGLSRWVRTTAKPLRLKPSFRAASRWGAVVVTEAKELFDNKMLIDIIAKYLDARRL